MKAEKDELKADNRTLRAENEAWKAEKDAWETELRELRLAKDGLEAASVRGNSWVNSLQTEVLELRREIAQLIDKAGLCREL